MEPDTEPLSIRSEYEQGYDAGYIQGVRDVRNLFVRIARPEEIEKEKR
jgi:hypothetical protein